MRQQAKTPLFKGGIKRRLGFEPSMGEKASAVLVWKPRPSRSSERQPELRLRAGRIPHTNERLGRRWMVTEWMLEYLRGAAEMFRGFSGFSMHECIMAM